MTQSYTHPCTILSLCRAQQSWSLTSLCPLGPFKTAALQAPTSLSLRDQGNTAQRLGVQGSPTGTPSALDHPESLSELMPAVTSLLTTRMVRPTPQPAQVRSDGCLLRNVLPN